MKATAVQSNLPSPPTVVGATVGVEPAPRHPAGVGWGGRVRDLLTLTKPRVVALLLVTTLVPMLIAPAGPPGAIVVLATLLGGYLMAGGANAINMWLDRDIDRKMSRTRLRPLPAGRLHPRAALAFGIALATLAGLVLALGANPLAAALAAGGLLFYVFVYSLGLKRRSPQNIVIGGAAGAFPPLVGWAAATGTVDLTALLLFAIVYYWTPPHFWALALVKRRDYAAAGVPMLPVAAGEPETRRRMLLYTGVLLPVTLLPAATGALGALYAVAALALGARFLALGISLVKAEESAPAAWRLYRFSLVYLFLLFCAMAADRLLAGV